MADGTLRLTVDIEPRHANDAFSLFGKPGVPMALAALKTEAQQRRSEQRSNKPGPIALWLIERCKEPAFQAWASPTMQSESAAADWCKQQCGVKSRRDIDGNPEAERAFNERVRRPWAQFNEGIE